MSQPPAHSNDGDDHSDGSNGEPQRREALSFWQIAGSTLAAALGVQSSRNRERDFTRGKAWHFIIAGIVFTVLFVLTIVFVVSLVA